MFSVCVFVRLFACFSLFYTPLYIPPNFLLHCLYLSLDPLPIFFEKLEVGFFL